MAKSHVVRAGECLQSIAALYGFFPDTLWRHPANAALAAARSHGSVLAPGDVLEIPARRDKEASAPTDTCTVFRRRAVPSIVRVRLDEDGARHSFVGLPFRVEIPGLPQIRGEVDAEGAVAAFIPCDARSATVIIDPEGAHERRIELRLGALRPVDTPEGARARLRNLDYLPADAPEDEATPQARRALRAAVRGFQRDHGLEPTGELDAATRRALTVAHGY